MKERVTLTIEQAILRQVDARINGNTIRNRSHAVEMLIREALRGISPQTAVILAGASKKHLDAELKELQEKPVIQHNIDLLVEAGIQHIIIISTQPEDIKQVIGEQEIPVTYIHEEQPLGTAGALKLATEHLTSTFVVLNANNYKDINILDMYAFHTSHESPCTIALTTTMHPEEHGVALMNGNSIVTFIEKPQGSVPSNLVSAGCYFIEPELLELIPDGYATLETDLFPKLTQTNSLFGYPFSGTYKRL